jgi:hypothetical protein
VWALVSLELHADYLALPRDKHQVAPLSLKFVLQGTLLNLSRDVLESQSMQPRARAPAHGDRARPQVGACLANRSVVVAEAYINPGAHSPVDVQAWLLRDEVRSAASR